MGNSEPDGWDESLRDLVVVPQEHARRTVTRGGALAMLRTDEAVLDRLIKQGLPSEGETGNECFDEVDLFNLALYSGSGRSLPELGALSVQRLTSYTPSTWTETRHWTLTVDLSCASPSRCERPLWTVWRPLPERVGGALLDHHATPDGVSERDGRFLLEEDADRVSLSMDIDTVGRHATVTDPFLLDLFRWIVEDFRFQRLPLSLEVDLEAVERLRVIDCVAASLLLERECRRAGYAARAVKGYLLGPIGIGDHAWLEVTDREGSRQTLEPALDMMAALGPSPNPEFAAFCRGSTLNRVIPSACPPGEAVSSHACAAGTGARVTTRVRSRKNATPAAGSLSSAQ